GGCDFGIDTPQLAPHCFSQSLTIARAAHHQTEVICQKRDRGFWSLRYWSIERWRRVVVQTSVLDVFDHTDNFILARGIAVTHVDKNVRADWLQPCEKAALQCLINQDRAGGVFIVAISKFAATHDWDFHCLKVT